MFKKGERIVYPNYGISIIKKITAETVGEKTVKCYEIFFLETKLTVTVPLDRADNLGLRYPMSKKELLKCLQNLYKKTTASEEEMLDLEKYSQSKLKSGSTKDAIDLVNTLYKVKQQREKEAKKLTMMEADNLERALIFLRSEVTTILGEKAANKFKL